MNYLTRCGLLLALFILPGALSALNIYVAPNGNDNNTGTQQRPLYSLTAARDKIRALKKQGKLNEPVFVLIQGGEYYMPEPLELTDEDSGTPEAPITYKAATNTTPVFYGGRRITGFRAVNKSLWVAQLPQTGKPWRFEQLFVNGRWASRAKSPDEGFYKVNGNQETIIDKGTAPAAIRATQKTRLNLANVSDPLPAVSDSSAIIVMHHKWDFTRRHLLNATLSRDTTAFVETIGRGYYPWNKLDAQTLAYFENYRTALDSPGEWFLEKNGLLYYMPKAGETIANTRIIAPTLEQLVVVKGSGMGSKQVHDLSFRNLTFAVSGYTMPDGGNEPQQAAATIPAAVMIDFADRILFTNCEIRSTALYAMWLKRGATNCRIEQCYLHDLGGGGIKIGEKEVQKDTTELTRHITVDNSIITRGGLLFPTAVGVLIFHSPDNVITHNEISDLKYTGISVGWIWGYANSTAKRNTISFNHIHHLGWGELSDMGGIYTLGASEGTVVSHNLVHDIWAYTYGGWGLYTDEGSTGVVMEKNLVYACKSNGFHQHYGKENIIRNNIFALNHNSQLAVTRTEPHLSFRFTNNIVYFNSATLTNPNWVKINLEADRNCYWNPDTKSVAVGNLSLADWQKKGQDQHSVIEDPLFVNPLAYDFRFRSQATAKKIGFTPFDYTKAGVYGSAAWKKKAVLPPVRIRRYEEATKHTL
ncbi:right-handed parallel beta-helix repeat-containing protein [Arsenicibacter rosenii]|uniref:Right handed beta helix domain-containing protein n=1 Tax=Arsenicibacter rosenii TaxID=1750698 RepID=A0A1S2VCG4_9BACT|nr:right-handed parallel beta-helix repeat-containing protein [Arsenicibacter rosenii]OIN56110.1 hypothetical protein BLX24_26420 [Arsenicibacter rosenii]